MSAEVVRMAASADEWVTIRNGQAWTDTDGNSVQAHGAGFLSVPRNDNSSNGLFLWCAGCVR